MPIVAIIQARTGSGRLPKKTLKKILGKPLIARLIERVKFSKLIDTVVLATSIKPEDQILATIAREQGIYAFLGHESNVLDRYYNAAKQYRANPIVRITGDCPLIDPKVIDEVISYYQAHQNKCDYVNTPENYPEGFDVEVFSFKTLTNAWKSAKKSSEKEHVTSYIKNNPNLFSIHKICNQALGDFSSFHWSVDYPEDLAFVRAIYKNLYPINPFFTLHDILKLVIEKPRLIKINQNKEHTGYEGYEKSLQEDVKKSELKISILIRTYNLEKTIARAVESAITQKFPKDQFEIIIVDDGSTDRTKQILKTYEHLPNIQIIHQKNKGSMDAAYTALNSAQGIYAIFLDGDDYFNPNLIKNLSKILDKNPEVSYVYCDYIEEFQNKRKTISVKNIFETTACNVMFRTSILKKQGFWRKELNFPEYDLFLRTLHIWKGVHVKKSLFVYSRRKNSATANSEFVQKGIEQLQKRHPDKLAEIKKIRSYAFL